MLFTNCQFLEGVDVSPVIPMMDIDLEQALLTGVVPDSGVVPEFNNLEDTDFIIGRVSDAFDAIEHQRQLNIVMNNYRASVSSSAPAESTEKSAE